MNKFYAYLIMLFIKTHPTNAFFLPANLIEEANSIKNMISSRAIVSTVTEQLNYQMINDNVLFSELAHSTFHPVRDLFYITIFATSAIIQYQLIRAKNEKWLAIKTYTDVQKVTNQVIWVILIVFTKGIDNAI